MQTDTTIIEAPAVEAPAAPVAVAPKPVKAPRKPRAAKPAKPQAPADKATAERDRAQANQAITRVHYNGASQASHATRAPKLADALTRIRNPIQRAKSATTRDESALALSLKHSDASGSFDPIAATSDLGTLSRLASLGFLTVNGNKAQLTKTGLALARNVSKRKAA